LTSQKPTHIQSIAILQTNFVECMPKTISMLRSLKHQGAHVTPKVKALARMERLFLSSYLTKIKIGKLPSFRKPIGDLKIYVASNTWTI
jgi:hypothetical protein